MDKYNPYFISVRKQFFFIFFFLLNIMMGVSKLTTKEREKVLSSLFDSGWKLVDDRDAIIKEYTFKDFNEAFGFMTRIALKADKMDHHPEWFNVSK